MRLQESGLPLEARRTVLEVLTGVPLPDDMPGKSYLLYRCLNKVQFVEHMPSFDEWGLRPVDLVGPRENPIIMVPLLATSPDPAPRVDAGGQVSSEAGGTGAGVSRSLRLPRHHPRGPVIPTLGRQLKGRRSPLFLRSKPLRPRQAATRRSSSASPSLTPLRTPWAFLQLRPEMVPMFTASAGSAWTSRSSARGRNLRAAAVAPSGR